MLWSLHFLKSFDEILPRDHSMKTTEQYFDAVLFALHITLMKVVIFPFFSLSTLKRLKRLTTMLLKARLYLY